MAAKAYPKKFSASHLKGAKFARRGLRSYFEYREIRHSKDVEMLANTRDLSRVIGIKSFQEQASQ